MANSSIGMWAVTVNKNKEITAIWDTDGESSQNTYSRSLNGEYKAVWLESKKVIPFIKDDNWAYDDAGLIKLIFKIGR